MSTRWLFLLALAGAASLRAADSKTAAPVATPTRPTATAPTVAAYETFRVITDRNIFSANRSGRRDRSNDEPVQRVDTISFVGTMDYEKGLFAFFDGSDSAYRKALRVGESVDAFKVTKITPSGVELERDGTALSMQVAQQLRRTEGGDWQLIGADAARAAEAARQAAAASDSETKAPAIPADASDTLRRLMEQRQKQLKQ